MYVFDRKLSSLSQTEIPDLSTSVNESLQDVTTELDTRATESDSPKHHQCMVSYVYGITKWYREVKFFGKINFPLI